MAQGNFARCNQRTRVYEGGNVDDPHDPGGRTSRGVTQRVYTAYRLAKHLNTRDVYLASEAEIADIYHDQYWVKAGCERLPAGVDFAVYDAAVNSGVMQAGRWLQRSLRGYTGHVDGVVGTVTVEACRNDEDNDALVARMVANRLGTLRTLKVYPRYKKGWNARCANVLKISQAWASGSVGPQPVDVSAIGGNRKATINEDTVRRPLLTMATANAVTASGTAATVAAETAQAIEPVREFFSWAPYVLGCLALAGALAAMIVKYGHAMADRSQRGEVSHPVDETADEDVPSVALNDNAPPAVEAAAIKDTIAPPPPGDGPAPPVPEALSEEPPLTPATATDEPDVIDGSKILGGKVTGTKEVTLDPAPGIPAEDTAEEAVAPLTDAQVAALSAQGIVIKDRTLGKAA